MSEQFGSNPEIAQLSEKISASLTGWIQQEVRSSMVGKNSVLDDYKSFHDDLLKPPEDPTNRNYGKASSHYDRLRLWTDLFATMPENETVTARQLFCIQMHMSGLFRIQCMLEADNQSDYYNRRLDSPGASVNLQSVVANKLQPGFGTLDKHINLSVIARPLPELVQATHHTNKQQNDLVRGLHGKVELTKAHTDEIKAMQGTWAELALDYIVFTANNHDGQLAAVPFWEPKSISESPAIYYPFRAA